MASYNTTVLIPLFQVLISVRLTLKIKCLDLQLLQQQPIGSKQITQFLLQLHLHLVLEAPSQQLLNQQLILSLQMLMIYLPRFLFLYIIQAKLEQNRSKK